MIVPLCLYVWVDWGFKGELVVELIIGGMGMANLAPRGGAPEFLQGGDYGGPGMVRNSQGVP